MAISPPTDLVMDVVRAADPRRAEDAARKLASYSPAAKPDDFARLLARPAPQPAGALNARWRSAPTTAPRAFKATASTGDPVTDAYRALGALLLQKMVENALPNKNGAGFGKGAAGDAWKSMLAEQVAQHAAVSAFRIQRYAKPAAQVEEAKSS